ncbi:MAG TPA: MMPL family transporter [Acidimicrobiia bacterium]|nr:MMPL family transporter [Acidimicrobiia bacterium]
MRRRAAQEVGALKTVIGGLARLVVRRPLAVFISMLVVTGVLGYLSGQVVLTDGNEGFAPEAEELIASEEIQTLFGDESSSSVLQVLVSAEDGDVVDLDGLAVIETVTGILEQSDLAPLLQSRPGEPAVISYMLPIQQAIALGEIEVPTSDAELKAAYTSILPSLPPEAAGVAEQLLSGDKDLAAPSASRGLVLVFISAPRFDDSTNTPAFDPANEYEDFLEVEEAVADQIRAATVPAGYTAEPFSFELIFASGDEFEAEVGRLFGMAAGIIVIILLFVYWVRPSRDGTRWARIRRTGADTLLTMAAIFMAITWMQGIGVLFGPKYLGWIDDFGPMNQIVPILLIGLGVDYAIHLTTRYREEAGGGDAVDHSMNKAIHTVGIALVLATVTTAVGFLTNLVSPIPALRDFGILAAVGIVSSFLIMMSFVAAFRVLLDRRAERADRLPRESLGATKERALPRLIGRTSILAEKAAVPVVMVALLLGAVGAFGVTKLKTEFSVTDFVPRPNPLLETFDTLTTDFAGGFGETTDVLITNGDVGTPEVHNAMAQSLGNLRGVPNVVTYGEFAAAESSISLIAAFADPASARFEPQFAQIAASAGFSADGTVSPTADVDALYGALFAIAPAEASRLIHRSDAGYDALLVSITTQAGEPAAGALAADIREAFAPVAESGAQAVPTSDYIIANVVVQSMSDSQLSSLVIAVVAAALLLVINFWIESKRPFLGIITIAPVALVMLWAFGLFPVFGLAFGPVTATVSALAIGIGVPYMIHITHRYQEDRIRCASPEEAVRSTTTNTGGALAGSAFTTIAGFGILMTASLVPFQQLGLVTAYTIFLALIGAVLVLPSMLVLWDRWHRRRGHTAIDEGAVRGAMEL